MTVDSEDNVLLAGSFYGALTVGGSTLTSAGHTSMFVAKLSPTGAVFWLESFGGYAPSPAWASRVKRWAMAVPAGSVGSCRRGPGGERGAFLSQH